jgi:hypothetical protein
MLYSTILYYITLHRIHLSILSLSLSLFLYVLSIMGFLHSTAAVLLCSLLAKGGSNVIVDAASLSPSPYSLVATIPWAPSVPKSVDQGVGYDGLLYMADRSNGALHIASFNSTGNATELAAVKGFAGPVMVNGTLATTLSGPNGVVILPDR